MSLPRIAILSNSGVETGDPMSATKNGATTSRSFNPSFSAMF